MKKYMFFIIFLSALIHSQAFTSAAAQSNSLASASVLGEKNDKPKVWDLPLSIVTPTGTVDFFSKNLLLLGHRDKDQKEQLEEYRKKLHGLFADDFANPLHYFSYMSVNYMTISYERSLADMNDLRSLRAQNDQLKKQLAEANRKIVCAKIILEQQPESHDKS